MLSRSLRQFLHTIYPHIEISSTVTDDVFLFIQVHPRLLSQYNQICNTYGTLVVNQMIGRLIKNMNDLSNNGRAFANSKLIQTYTLH